MAASLSGVYSTQQFTDAGLPASGYRLYSYSYGTTTLKTAYTDAAGTIAHTYTSDGLGGSYIALNARGELPAPLYLTTGSYDLCLKTAAGSTVWTRRADPISDVGGVALAADLASSSDASKGDAEVGAYDAYATAYLKNLSQIRNGERYNMLNGVPTAQRAAIQAYTSSYDCWADISTILTDMDGAKRGDLYFSDGLYNVSAAITAMGLKQRISGANRRGFGSGASNYRGSILKATNNTGILTVAPGALVSSDILIEHLMFLGTSAGTTADGLSFTNVSGVDINYCVVANFGRYGINTPVGAGTSYINCSDVYSAQNTTANFNIDAQYCQLHRCSGDGAQYGIYVTANGGDLSVDGRTHMEGSTVYGVYILGNQVSIADAYFNMTASSGNGLFCSGAGLSANNVRLRGINTNAIGFDISGIEHRLIGLKSVGFVIGGKLETGFGSLIGSVIEGTTTGLSLVTGGFGQGIVDGCTVSGPTNSLLHNAGNWQWKLGVNRYDDGSGNYKPITVTAGIPLMTWQTSQPTTITSATYTVLADSDSSLTVNFAGTLTLTLPLAASHPGKPLRVKTITANTVVSASANVVPVTGGAAGTAILAATAGKWADLVSDGTSWQIMASN